MSQPPATTVDDRAGVLHAVMRDPPPNALGEALIEALAAVVEEFEQGEAKVLMLSSALPEFFATGAEALGEPDASLELAMACTLRFCSRSARLAMPGVDL